MIEVKITADQPGELAATLAGLCALFAVPAVTAADATPPVRRTRGKSKADEQAADPVSETEVETPAETVASDTATAETAVTAQETPKTEEPVSREDIRKRLVAEAAKLDQAQRGAFVQGLLNPLGVKKLGDLPDEKLPLLVAAIDAHLGGDSALD